MIPQFHGWIDTDEPENHSILREPLGEQLDREVKERYSQKQCTQGRRVLKIYALNCMILTLLFHVVIRAETKLEVMTETKRCKKELVNVEFSFYFLSFPVKRRLVLW